MTRTLQALKSANSDVLKYLLMASLIAFSYFGLIVVVFNLYLLRLGYDTRFIGVANGCMPIAFALSGIISGILGRKLGSRRTTATALVFAILGVSLLPLTENLAAEYREIVIILLRITSGIGVSLFLVNLHPYLIAATSAKERVLIFSLQTATGHAAGFMGSIFASFLPSIIIKFMRTDISSPLPFACLLVLSGLILIPGIPIVLTTRERLKPNTTNVSKKQATNIKPIIYIMIFFCITSFFRANGSEVVKSFFNVYLEVILSEPPWRIGLIMAGGHIAALCGALLSPVIATRTGKINGVVLATVTTAAGLIITILMENWQIATLGYAIAVCARTILWTLFAVVQMEIVPPAFRGITAGSVALSSGLGFGSMALLGGYLIPIIGFKALFLISAGLCSISAAVFWQYFHKPRGKYCEEDIS